MKKSVFRFGLALGLASALSLSFAGGYLTSELVAKTHPPGFKIVTDYRDEIPLIRLTDFDGRELQGSFQGKQPRFLLGPDKDLIVPDEDGSFRLDLQKLK